MDRKDVLEKLKKYRTIDNTDINKMPDKTLELRLKLFETMSEVGRKTNEEPVKETEIGVTWQEAFEAGLEGKRIKVYGQYLTYPKFETLHYALNYLSIRPNYYKDLLKKEWYIEKS